MALAFLILAEHVKSKSSSSAGGLFIERVGGFLCRSVTASSTSIGLSRVPESSLAFELSSTLSSLHTAHGKEGRLSKVTGEFKTGCAATFLAEPKEVLGLVVVEASGSS
jgi:hypothetical protein